jgi:membrane protease YdiL (CAAX protease family)
MLAESALLALPIFVLGQTMAILFQTTTPAAAAAATTPTANNSFLHQLFADAAHASGAGLYEEFVFRFVGIAALHFVLADLARAPKRIAAAAAVLITAALFAIYHDLRNPDNTIDTRKAVFLFAAGIYFGAVYLARGFGIAVGTHAVYDVLAFQTANN